jgi:RNA polymerase sigma-70 factor (ECF subfamily)
MIDRAQSNAPDPHAALERRDEEALFESALEHMDIDQRAAFVLFELEDMTGPEVAEALGVPLGTAYSRLRLARQAFQAAVDRSVADEARLLRRRGVS